MVSGKGLWGGILSVRASAGIVLVIFLAYLVLSGGGYFIPAEKIVSMGFGLSQPHNIFSFLLVHTGYVHLLANIVSIAVFAVLVERVLGSRATVFIFLFAQYGAAVVFSVLNPNTVLVGASAGASGLMAAGLALRPARGVAAIVILLIAMNMVFIPLSSAVLEQHKEGIAAEELGLGSQIDEAVERGDDEAATALNKSLMEGRERMRGIEAGELMQEKTPTDFWIHGYAAFFGVLYLFAFRREKLGEGVGEFKWVLGKFRKKRK